VLGTEEQVSGVRFQVLAARNEQPLPTGRTGQEATARHPS